MTTHARSDSQTEAAQTLTRWRSGVLSLGLAAFIALPSRAGFFTGVPFGRSAILMLLGCWLVWYLPRRGQIAGKTLRVALMALAGLAAAKIGLSSLAMEHGLEGTYFPNDNLDGPGERSSDFRALASTRIDSTIAFGPENFRDFVTVRGWPLTSFPLYFLNDVGRFNFWDNHGPNRASLAFSVRWRGYFIADKDATYDFAVDSPNPVSLWVDEVRRIQTDPLYPRTLLSKTGQTRSRAC